MPFWGKILLQIISLGGTAIADRVRDNKANRQAVAEAKKASAEAKKAAEAAARTEQLCREARDYVRELKGDVK